MSVRKILLQMLSNSLGLLSGERLVESALPALIPQSGRWRVIAIGKAAASMACGAINCLGIENISQLLVITKTGQAAPWTSRLSRTEIIESAHPIPDQKSLQAGQRLLDIIRQESTETFLFLISGGASSLVEVLRPGVQLDDLQHINRWLQASGLPVHAINAVRSRLSMIKGGRLTSYLNRAVGCALLLSDVQGNNPAIIGSGLLCAAHEPEALPQDLPDWLLNLLPASDEFLPDGFPNHVIANLDTVRDVSARVARKTGLPVTVIDEDLSGSAEKTGMEIAEFIVQSTPGIYILGGETTVKLPQQPGHGGRNQHLALAAATQLAGRDDIYLLAVGTDGDDGNTDDAGALVDGGTIERGTDAGLDAADCLSRADAGSFLEASGDLVTTGPTGTNLRDLVIALKR